MTNLLSDLVPFYSTLLNVIITLIIIYIITFYVKVSKYPRGVFPLPFIGNLLEFKDKSLLPHQVFAQISSKCGRSIFTFWMSSSPFVVITNYNQAKELYHEKKNLLAARPPLVGFDELLVNGELDMALRNSDLTWEIHRKIASKSVRQFSRSPYRAKLTYDLLDEVLNQIKSSSKPVDPTKLIKKLVICTLTGVTFGGEYNLNHDTISKIVEVVDLQASNADFFVAANILPGLKYLARGTWKKFESASRYVESVLWPFLHKKRDEIDFDDQDFECKDFLDAFLIAAESIKRDGHKEKMETLTDKKILTSVWSLFLGGVHTTKDTLRWAVLILSYYPQVQAKLRDEVRAAASTDSYEFNVDYLKDLCPNLNAFIAEVLRFRPVGPTGIPRCAIQDIEVNGTIIPKGSTVLLSIMPALHDASSWDLPEIFNMERFIDENGQFTIKHSAYIPFSVGRRSCVGEKMARANLFLILFKLINDSKSITLADPNVSLEPDPLGNPFQTAVPYEIIIQ